MGVKNLFEKQPASHVKKKQYNFHQMIGEGTFGAVKQATWTQPDGQKREVAVKCIQKKLVKAKPSVVQDEADVLQGLSHRNVIKILDFFESKDKYYLTFELVQGGELFEAIVARHHFSEHDAATIISATLSAVSYLHGQNICHRDLKPENLLLRTKDPKHLDEIVLCDFGVAKHLYDGVDLNKTLVGSPGYSAPELFDKDGYRGQPADVWSIGVIAYALLSGTTPFKSKDPEYMLKEQMKGKIQFDRAIWESISAEAKDFIQKCCQVKPADRMTAKQACEHPWIKQETARTSHDLGDELRQTLSRHVQDGGGTRYNSRRPLNPSEQEVYTDSSASELSSDASSANSSEASLTSRGSDTSQEVNTSLSGKVSAIEV